MEALKFIQVTRNIAQERIRVDEVRAVDAGLGHGVESALGAGDEGVVIGGHFVAVADAEDDAAGGAGG